MEIVEVLSRFFGGGGGGVRHAIPDDILLKLYCSAAKAAVLFSSPSLPGRCW